MAQPVIQTSFHAGEWAPALNARVDVAKYHSGVALGLNYFVDFRGGLSSRMGTKYIIQTYDADPDKPVRLIGFQLTATVGYILEFGDFTLRFHRQGAPVLETGVTITGISQANPGVVTAVAHGYSTGDVVYISDVLGMTQVNVRYYKITVLTANTFSLQDLNGVDVNTSGYTAYSSAGTTSVVYMIATPWSADQLSLLKFTQNVDRMYFDHPDVREYVLQFIDATNWTLTASTYGCQTPAPTSISVATTLAAGSVNYSYTVTAVGANGEESSAGTPFALASKTDLRTVAGTNRVTWTAVTGAIRYNVYKAELSYTNAVPSGAIHGFIGDATGTAFDDSNIAPDFGEAPPIPQNPFQGAGVSAITVTNAGTYTSVPTVTIGAAPSGGVTATAGVSLGVVGTPTSGADSLTATVGQAISYPNGVVLIVASLNAFNFVATYQPITYPGSSAGSLSAGSTPSNPVVNTTGNYVANFTWGVHTVSVISPGAGYTSAPTVTFSSGAATATAEIGSASTGNPLVPQFIWQRLARLGTTGSPQEFHFSKIGLYNNFDISNPVQPDDAISGVLISNTLCDIKSAIPMTSGLVIFTSKNAWVMYGDAAGSPASATAVTANPQAFNGANDVPPIVVNDHILYVQAKSNSVRDLAYNFYTNVFTGTDISILSSHLFFGQEITAWAWAEEPFKTAWAIRADGVALSLTYLKEQDLIGWCHSDTQGFFNSVATVTEETDNGLVDGVYFVIQRTVNGNTVNYIERMADRFFDSITDAGVWCVDSGLQYNGAPETDFSGAEHLAGMEVVGLADGIPITPFTMPTTGFFSLASAASVVTVGLGYTPQFQTLALDTGNPTIQGKDKKISAVTVRVERTLGLTMGQTFETDSQKVMKDLVLGNVGTMTNEVLTDLLTGDARMVIDPDWTEPGQYCINQPNPYPVTILGVIPEITLGDTK